MDALVPRSQHRFRLPTVDQLVLAICLAIAIGLGSCPAIASTAYGDLNNFDVFNDTNDDCHGFEIELEDIHSTDITYTYDWNHYGKPAITDDHSDPVHPKVVVRYAASWDQAAQKFTAFTSVPAAPPAPTQGHQCTNPAVNIGCEHFGVGHYGVHGIVRYFWLVKDPMNPTTLIRGPAVNVASPNWNYYPPAGGQPAQVQAQIEAPPPPPAPVFEFGDATWVKAIVTTSHNGNPLDLADLVSDDPDDPNDENWAHGEPDEVEVEWQLMQMEFKNPDGVNNDLMGGMEGLPNGDEVVTRRYEFYKYVGPLDPESNEAVCSNYPQITDPQDPKYKAECDPASVTILGDYIGAQMAGFNVESPLGLIEHVPDADLFEPFVDRTLVVGGNTPYTTLVSLGALPAGLGIDSATGVLSGQPTLAGYSFFSITATDADAVQVSKAYSMKVGPGSPGDVTGLRVSKSANGVDLVLEWEPSCGAHATDYEVYRGALLGRLGYEIVTCTTGGALSKTVTPSAGSDYYLVVPRSPDAEGSYGQDSNGLERPAADQACLASQVVQACP